MDGDVFSLFLQSLVDYPARTQSWPMSRLLGDLYCSCIALHRKTLYCFALHCIISKHILGAFIEAALTEKRCHATRWNTALSLPLLWWAAVGHGWPVSGGSCILCLRRFTIESKCWKKHILNLDEYEMKHKREHWWCNQCGGVRCGDGNFGIFDLQSRVKAVRRLQLGIL